MRSFPVLKRTLACPIFGSFALVVEDRRSNTQALNSCQRLQPVVVAPLLRWVRSQSRRDSCRFRCVLAMVSVTVAEAISPRRAHHDTTTGGVYARKRRGPMLVVVSGCARRGIEPIGDLHRVLPYDKIGDLLIASSKGFH